MLAPIYDFLFYSQYLGLSKEEVLIYYSLHRSDNLADMQTIIDEKLAPGMRVIKNKSNSIKN